jgi:hypothetical protein
MNKAPVTQHAPAGRSFWKRTKSSGTVLPVAEALTDQQAAEALAEEKARVESQRANREMKAQAKAAAKSEREARKLAKQAAKQAALEASRAERARTGRSPSGGGDGRFHLSIGGAGFVAAAGALVAIIFGAYTIGKQSLGSGQKLATVAASTAPASAKLGSPLLPRTTENPVVVPKPLADKVQSDPDLQHLLQQPPLAQQRVAANTPVSVKGPAEAATEANRPENLNYLQIESFLITRERSGEQLARDLAEVRAFLLNKGVRTFARKRSNGYVLFAEDGFPPGKASREDRGGFKRKLEKLGAEYRSQGGLYQFKGCLFVSYSATKAGDPV